MTAASYATSTAYDSLNNPTNVSWNPVPTQTFNSSQSVTFDFSYDANNRRINQTATNKSWWSYPTAASSVCYASNALNQYSSFGAFGACGSSTPITPTYDANGDLTCDGSFNYSYDAERHLTEIQAGACGSPTTTVATYVYDAQERRKSKIVGSTTTIYVTDADNREVLEYDGTTGAQENWYAYGLGSNDALNQMNLPGNTRETLVPDAQGSVIASLDALSGNLINTGYQTYGESPGLATAGFHYTAQYFDPETAGSAHEPNGLYYYRSRMYSPTLGRFLQPDTAGYSAGMNLYAYVGNDPPNNGDATGQASPSPIAMGDYTTGLIACGGDTNCRAQYQNSMDEGGLALSLGGVAVAGCIAACAEIGAGIGLVGGGKMAIGFTFGFGGAQIAGYGVLPSLAAGTLGAITTPGVNYGVGLASEYGGGLTAYFAGVFGAGLAGTGGDVAAQEANIELSQQSTIDWTHAFEAGATTAIGCGLYGECIVGAASAGAELGGGGLVVDSISGLPTEMSSFAIGQATSSNQSAQSAK